MSLDVIKAQIKAFLKTDTPEVVALTGRWGTGKTFTWDECLKEAREQQGLGLTTYSYVSLFGISSITDLKTAIAIRSANDVTKSKLPIPQKALPAVETLNTWWVSFKKNWMQSGEAIDIPHINVFRAYAAVGFQFLENAVICIDDFERGSISGKELLGLVSLLKEQKNCKVILILNDQQASPEQLKEFNDYAEKVIDRHLLFAPTPEECCAKGIASTDAVSQLVKKNLITLRVDNIRIIKKISLFAQELSRSLVALKLHPRVLEQSIHTLCLYAWAKYGPHPEVPPMSVINRYALFLHKDSTQQEQEWVRYIQSYGFGEPDALDKEIEKFLKDGFIRDHDGFSRAAQTANTDQKHDEHSQAIHKAWRLYHDSFDDNANEVADAMEAALRGGLGNMGIGTIGSSVNLIRELGFDARADKIVDDYFALLQKSTGEINFEYAPDEIRDPKVITGFKALRENRAKKHTLIEILDKLSGRNGWSREDQAVLVGASEADYYKVFKTTKGLALDAYIKVCMQFKGHGGEPEWQGIYDKSVSALQKIGRESSLNARRVRKYGIAIEPEKTEKPAPTETKK